MIVANIHRAKTTLSKLIEQAEAGEEVVIARNGKPVVRLTLILAEAAGNATRRSDGLPAWMGSFSDKIWIGPGFAASDVEVAAAFDDGKLFPTDAEG